MTSGESTKKEVLQRMAAMCSHSEQCSPDIRKKILAAGLTNDETEEILARLKKEKFIDDERYAKAYVVEKFKINKWGRIKMRYYLRNKGLSDTVIETGMDEIDDEKYKAALIKTMKEKARMVKKKNRFEKMGQIIRFTQSRGFEPELIHRYINEVLE